MNFQPTLLKRQESSESSCWNCSNCTFSNSSYLTQCQVCGQSHIIQQLQQCFQCSAMNNIKSKRCQVCDSILGQKKQKEPMVFCWNCYFENHKDNQSCVTCGEILMEREQKETVLKVPECPICLIKLYKNQEQHIKACEESLMMIEKLALDDKHLEIEDEDMIIRPIVPIKPVVKPIKPIVSVYPIKPIKPVKPIKEIKPVRPIKSSPYYSGGIVPVTLNKVCENCQVQFSPADYATHILTCVFDEIDLQSIVQVRPSQPYLTPLQMQAMDHMQITSRQKHKKARPLLQAKIKKLGFKLNDLQALEHYLQNYAPIIVHIHINKHMQFFVKDTHYRNQFQTGKSSGTLSRDSRNSWQNRMFDSKYSKSTDSQKVKYGTINFTNDPAGVNACKSYGNSYLLLKEEVRSRCTFTDMDSSNANSSIGTFKHGDHILNKLSDAELQAAINAAKANEVSSNVVTTYKEIQIHGSLEFARDVQRLYVSKLEYTGKLRNLVQQFSKKFGVLYQVF